MWLGGKVHNYIYSLYPICVLKTDGAKFIMKCNMQSKIFDTLEQMSVLWLCGGFSSSHVRKLNVWLLGAFVRRLYTSYLQD